MPPFAIIALVLILARAITELWLSRLNQRHVRAHGNETPPAFRGIMDEATYRRSVDYTLAKSRFADITGVFDAALIQPMHGFMTPPTVRFNEQTNWFRFHRIQSWRSGEFSNEIVSFSDLCFVLSWPKQSFQLSRIG